MCEGKLQLQQRLAKTATVMITPRVYSRLVASKNITVVGKTADMLESKTRLPSAI